MCEHFARFCLVVLHQSWRGGEELTVGREANIALYLQAVPIVSVKLWRFSLGVRRELCELSGTRLITSDWWTHFC
jgi:hypothetical protein